MFSEYASRFLAQSQSRLGSFTQGDTNVPRNPLDRQAQGSLRAPSRSHLQRQPLGNPYQSIRPSRFAFGSRVAQPQAPLFYSATDDFREEDDNEEHERDVADFYALQRSRRDFGASRLEPSDDEGNAASRRFPNVSRKGFMLGAGETPRVRGIRSSWTGDEPEPRSEQEAQQSKIVDSAQDTKVREARLVDVELASTELASTIKEDDETDAHLDLDDEKDDDPPSIQHFRRPIRKSYMQDSTAIPEDDEGVPFVTQSDTAALGPELLPNDLVSTSTDLFTHDSFWAALFLIDMAALIATFILVCLHTSAPSSNSLYGDTIYTTMKSSFHLLGIYTVVAIIVAFLWLAALRSFMKPLVILILIGVPIIALSFSLYPFISSFRGDSFQDRAMRWFSLAPALFAIGWTYTAYKGRKSLGRAIELLNFATRILTACPALVLVGFATLAIVVTWTWAWMLMFTRIFLGGHLSTSKHMFIIDTSTWWLGIFFIISYLWGLAVISGIQRATNAAATSQWYFYRNNTPAPTSHRIIHAALSHATTKIFGTICFSTLLSLAVRLPLLLLPGRIAGYLSFCLYSFVPTPIATLTNPLTLTYAAIHSQPLTISARGLSELSFVSSTSPTMTLTPRAFSKNRFGQAGAPNLVAYRLAKLLLHSTRFAASLAFGFGGWVSTARMLQIAGQTVRGSLYAYVVGLIAGAIGWAVLGAMEGVLGGVLDAVVVCWGNDIASHGFGQARFCREAGQLLGDEGAEGAV